MRRRATCSIAACARSGSPSKRSATRRLRTRGIDTPILLLTGRGGVKDRVRGLDAGADDYLAKPFAFEELIARLRAVTRRGRTRQLEAVLSYGPVELDP